MRPRKTLRIGIDDTDSELGMCTTYLAYRIVGDLRRRGDEIAEYPRLVRLNPNVPWKTRGNGAVGITVRTRDVKGAKKCVESRLEEYADVRNGANPGLAFLESDKVPDELAEFAREALWRIIPRSRARRTARRTNTECRWIGNGRGLVGAISAIGYRFGDSTMELLAYRRPSRIGRPREIEAESVRQMHERTFPFTFNSYDARTQKVLIAPHGDDPVLYGIRGEGAGDVIGASRTIRGEASGGHMVFVSNQGTGDHLANALDPKGLRAYDSGTVEGRLVADPHIIGGGHVRLELETEKIRVHCYVYQQTGMGGPARSLVRGDRIRVGGSVRRARAGAIAAFNVETLRAVRLADVVAEANPMCRPCSKRMKSKGVGQGYECARCGRTARAKERTAVRRTIGAGTHVALVTAQRHLSRPAHRARRTARRQMRPRHPAWMS